MKKEASEADRIKLLSDGGPTPVGGVPKLGDKPRSIRKRGFWRAFKRGELWALIPYHMNKITLDLEKQMYGTKIIYDRNIPNDRIYLTYPIIQELHDKRKA